MKNFLNEPITWRESFKIYCILTGISVLIGTVRYIATFDLWKKLIKGRTKQFEK